MKPIYCVRGRARQIEAEAWFGSLGLYHICTGAGEVKPHASLDLGYVRLILLGSKGLVCG